ncbi:MAG: MOSC N-terminal beta barrel domain-containing protein [Candidatus Poribacteria bacterium]|nr:MOSC N-terminal beta barrel domain-containing protein [Candidatus Poribacteria bacterium]
MSLTVASLHVYPVKSLGGIQVETAEVGRRGFQYDRLWMVVDSDGQFRTQRETPRMCLIKTHMRDGELRLSADGMPDLRLPMEGGQGARRSVVVWGDECGAIDQGKEPAEWLSDFLKKPSRLVRMADNHRREAGWGDSLVGFADRYAFLFISEASLDDLNSRLETPLPMNRFRPNIVVRGAKPYEEDEWSRVKIGETRFRGRTRCTRCATTATDQETAARGVEPLRTLATYRRTPKGDVAFGRNFNHLDIGGQISVGDVIDTTQF